MIARILKALLVILITSTNALNEPTDLLLIRPFRSRSCSKTIAGEPTNPTESQVKMDITYIAKGLKNTFDEDNWFFVVVSSRTEIIFTRVAMQIQLNDEAGTVVGHFSTKIPCNQLGNRDAYEDFKELTELPIIDPNSMLDQSHSPRIVVIEFSEPVSRFVIGMVVPKAVIQSLKQQNSTQDGGPLGFFVTLAAIAKDDVCYFNQVSQLQILPDEPPTPLEMPKFPWRRCVDMSDPRQTPKHIDSQSVVYKGKPSSTDAVKLAAFNHLKDNYRKKNKAELKPDLSKAFPEDLPDVFLKERFNLRRENVDIVAIRPDVNTTATCDYKEGVENDPSKTLVNMAAYFTPYEGWYSLKIGAPSKKLIKTAMIQIHDGKLGEISGSLSKEFPCKPLSGQGSASAKAIGVYDQVQDVFEKAKFVPFTNGTGNWSDPMIASLEIREPGVNSFMISVRIENENSLFFIAATVITSDNVCYHNQVSKVYKASKIPSRMVSAFIKPPEFPYSCDAKGVEMEAEEDLKPNPLPSSLIKQFHEMTTFQDIGSEPMIDLLKKHVEDFILFNQIRSTTPEPMTSTTTLCQYCRRKPTIRRRRTTTISSKPKSSTSTATPTEVTTIATTKSTTKVTTVATTEPITSKVTTIATTKSTTKVTTVATTEPITSKVTTIATTEPTTAKVTTIPTTEPITTIKVTTIATTEPTTTLKVTTEPTTAKVTTILTMEPTTTTTTKVTTIPTTEPTTTTTTKVTTIATTEPTTTLKVTTEPTTAKVTTEPTTAKVTTIPTTEPTTTTTTKVTTIATTEPTTEDTTISTTEPTTTRKKTPKTKTTTEATTSTTTTKKTTTTTTTTEPTTPEPIKRKLPQFCAKPSFWDSQCASSSSVPKPTKKIDQLMGMKISKMPFEQDLWLHIDLFNKPSVAEADRIQMKSLAISIANLDGHIVGRFAEFIPCIQNHEGSSAKSRNYSELFELLDTDITTNKRKLEVYECPTDPVLNINSPATSSFLKFREPVEAVYFHFKFTEQEFLSMATNTAKTTGFQVMVIILDDDGICYTHLLSRKSGVKKRLSTTVPKKSPINCHAGGGVEPYGGSPDNFVLPATDPDYDTWMDFSSEHPVPRKPANVPKIQGEMAKVISEHNENKYDGKMSTTEEPSVVFMAKADKPAVVTASSDLADADLESGGTFVLYHPKINKEEPIKRSSRKHQLYLECEHTKGCIGDPIDCIHSKSCQSIISYVRENDKVRFEIYSKSQKYAAVGLSLDRLMGNDTVVECVREGDNKINAYVSWNYGKPFRHNIRSAKSQQSDISDISGIYEDGSIYCTFLKVKNTEHNGVTFDLENSEYFLFNVEGSVATDGPQGNVEIHDQVVISKRPELIYRHVGKSPIQLVIDKIHGVSMLLVWVFILPTTAFITRYFKETFINTYIRKLSLWYGIHMIGMITSIVLTVFSTFLIYAFGSRWPGKKGWSFHTISGLIIIFIMLIQVPLALGVLKYNRKFKHFFLNFTHGFNGHFLFFLAFTCTYKSREMRDGLPCEVSYVLIAFLVTYLVIHLCMSYQVCYSDFVQGRLVSRTYTLGPLDVPDRLEEGMEEPGALGRKILLVVFVFVGIVFTLILNVEFLGGRLDCVAVHHQQLLV